MPRLLIIFHTIISLQPIQIRYQIWYRIRGRLRKLTGFKYALSKPKKTTSITLTPWVEKRVSFQNYSYTFLNVSVSISPNSLSATTTEADKLWYYNLNYMDFLLQPGMGRNAGLRLINIFIELLADNNVAKEPYTIALRGINWIKFFSKYEITDIRINESLYAQYLILMDNIEYHLLGNHLLEDAISLLYGSFYFSDKSFFGKAEKILFKELNEQILNDGAHFELSPMYHQIILDRLLDAANLLNNNKLFDIQDGLIDLILEKVSVMLGWLEQVTYNTGEIPLLNDSTFDVAPDSKQIFEYASRLAIPKKIAALSNSGYRAINTADLEVRIDVGNIGPDYNPGHSHADTFNFELKFKNNPIIVDTGVSTYKESCRRLHERSTAAHNTVELEGNNSSDVWSGFRVGRKAKISELIEGDQSIRATHNGYKRLGTVHSRTFTWADSSIKIKDELSGQKSKGVARFHFHPDVYLQVRDRQVLAGGVWFSFGLALDIELKDYEYAPEFNILIPSKVLVVTFEKQLDTIIHEFSQ